MANNQSSNLIGSHESDQQLGIQGHLWTSIQAAIGSLIFILLTTLQVRYQNDHNSPFETHGLIMKIFVVFAFMYVAMAAISLQIQYSHCTSSYILVLSHFGLVLGAFVCDFLLLILVPVFGYFVLVLCILMLLILLFKSYQQIVKLIHGVAKLAFDGSRDLLRHVYGYHINIVWIQQIIMFVIRIQFNLPRINIIAGSEEGHVANDLESNQETS